LIIRARSVGRR